MNKLDSHSINGNHITFLNGKSPKNIKFQITLKTLKTYYIDLQVPNPFSYPDTVPPQTTGLTAKPV